MKKELKIYVKKTSAKTKIIKSEIIIAIAIKIYFN